jgi:hypothetical protein
LEQIKALLPQFIGTPKMKSNSASLQCNSNRDKQHTVSEAGLRWTCPIRTVGVKSQNWVLAWRGGEFPEIDLDVLLAAAGHIRAIAQDSSAPSIGDVGDLGGFVNP